jgi:predicted membrane protein
MNVPPVMKGGAKEHVMDMIKKYAQPLNIYVGILLVLGITYVRQIPKMVAFRANTFLGRLFLFALTIIIADTYSWIYALLMALFTVLIIAVAPRTLKEAFQDKGTQDVDVKLVTQKKKWWSEELMEENPLGIEDDKVKTSAIQDSGNTSNSTTSSR